MLGDWIQQCLDEGATLSPKYKNVPTRHLAKEFSRQFGNSIHPHPGDSLAVVFGNHKTTALFFDRIWHPPYLNDDVPHEALFWPSTQFELFALTSFAIFDPEVPHIVRKVADEHGLANFPDNEITSERKLSEHLFISSGIMATPVYFNQNSMSKDYSPGNTEVLVATISNILSIDDDRLTWRQVEEIRRDKDARAKLVRFKKWSQLEFSGKSVEQIRDQITVQLDDYEWALKKHGVLTIAGVASDLVDIKFFPAVAATTLGVAATGHGVLAALGAASLAVGRASVSVAKRLIDLNEARRAAGPEVAFLHELRQKTSK